VTDYENKKNTVIIVKIFILLPIIYIMNIVINMFEKPEVAADHAFFSYLRKINVHSKGLKIFLTLSNHYNLRHILLDLEVLSF
jgi:hypothetical protein